MKRYWTATTALFLSVAAFAYDATAPAVTVDKTPAQIAYRSFDPRNPPAEIKSKFLPNEAGLCQYDFVCKIQTGVELPRSGRKNTQATVTSIRIVTGLNITVWTIAGASPKVHAHEQAHREICELYYQPADKIALRLGRLTLGEKLDVPARNQDAGLDVALDEFQKKLLGQYLAETAKRCVIAQKRFDAITNHGLKPLAEGEAKARAVADERAMRISQPDSS